MERPMPLILAILALAGCGSRNHSSAGGSQSSGVAVQGKVAALPAPAATKASVASGAAADALPTNNPPAEGTGATGQADRAPANAAVELDLTLVHADGPAICPADSYIWPGGCLTYSAGYTTIWSAGEVMTYAYAPAGTYDLKVTVTPFSGQSGDVATGIVKNIVISGEGGLFQVPLSSGGSITNVAIQLAAQSPTRPDGSICAKDHGGASSCNSSEPLLTCSVTIPAAHGSVSLKTTGCEGEALYNSLQMSLCAAGYDVKESQFAKTFACTH